ncbi:hypothetical protein DSM106972_086290 [Dulcicalothrix desertica PCC 7102]|uniref:CobQ/CobB/MinD/ParA nucleotide binding domain-containing protein n=1 Tax=Dulcicalothrix desertica PCC 7102 TaxID=232991 RepID=A0A433US15_9CYAN|nr:cobalamin biosynthesis protein CobQ [Dulcicalothrix desertica]RUS96606.1 hypothetical protein DSM106972_086290 [Dulcicalothrix desertica PCC 7102]TWH43860.1 hypothetical protein CAL7102_07608 [Dulcicalothrix desertica PCC 7102]
MDFQQPKRKRGRPRKYIANSNVDNSTTMKENTNLNNSPTETASENKRVYIEDWEQELDGDSNPANLDLSEHDNTSNNELPSGSGAIPFDDLEENLTHSTIIHIIDGEKGGAGKSFVSKTLIEYCVNADLDFAIVDADTSNQDIAKLYHDVKPAFFSDDEKQAHDADEIFDLALERSVIVNLPAQVYTNVTNWITRNSLTQLGKEHSITFIKWFVCTGGVDSVNFFLKSLNDLGGDVTHVFVKNMGLCDDWNYIDKMPEFIEAQRVHQFTIMNFPKFPFWERNMVDRLGVTFSGATMHPDFKVISKQRVKNFLKEAYAAFSLTGLIR